MPSLDPTQRIPRESWQMLETVLRIRPSFAVEWTNGKTWALRQRAEKRRMTTAATTGERRALRCEFRRRTMDP
jgi:hypothetical protein